MTKKLIIREISKDERELFEAIRDPEYTNFALMKIKFQGIETSCIVSINEELTKETELIKSGNYQIKPLAILVNDDILNNFKILCPSGDPPK